MAHVEDLVSMHLCNMHNKYIYIYVLTNRSGAVNDINEVGQNNGEYLLSRSTRHYNGQII